MPNWTDDNGRSHFREGLSLTDAKKIDQLREALKQLRIDANRLADRQLGGSYEQDVRRSIAEADRVLRLTRPE